MKYIMFVQNIGDGADGMSLKRYIPVMFPNNLTHSLMRDACLTSEEFKNATIVSAGEFSSLDMSDIECHGRSETLGVSFGEEDAAIIRTYDYTHGL